MEQPFIGFGVLNIKLFIFIMNVVIGLDENSAFSASVADLFTFLHVPFQQDSQQSVTVVLFRDEQNLISSGAVDGYEYVGL